MTDETMTEEEKSHRKAMVRRFASDAERHRALADELDATAAVIRAEVQRREQEEVIRAEVQRREQEEDIPTEP